MVTVLAVAAVSSCREEIVPEPYRPSNAHDGYRHALEEAGLSTTALGREWTRAASSSLDHATSVSPPFREVLYVDPADAFAIGYRFKVKRGQRTEVEARLTSPSSGRIFIDLFRLENEKDPQPVASAPENEARLEFEPRREGEYVVRLQSELLRGGQLEVTISALAAMAFPVEGHSTRSIQSGFGAPREGGRRKHHGVDIFAPRHTRVLAPSRAFVSHVGERGLGGRVVWLRDQKRSAALYFAHLETQAVEEGTWVEAGDLIGTVGNSGNARTTPPHLHFGIYLRGVGPVDPKTYIHQVSTQPKRISAQPGSLGTWVRSTTGAAPIYSSPSRRSDTERLAEAFTPMRIMGGAADYYRVDLPDGGGGFVSTRAVERVGEPISVAKLSEEKALLDRPTLGAPAKSRLPAGLELPVQGRFGAFEWVQAPQGNGWLAGTGGVSPRDPSP